MNEKITKVQIKYKVIYVIFVFCIIAIYYFITNYISEPFLFLVLLFGITVISQGVIIYYLRKYYLGEMIKNYKRFLICERGMYLGSKFGLKSIYEYQYFKIVSLNFLFWENIDNYQWDEDIGQDKYLITFVLNDGLYEKRQFRTAYYLNRLKEIENGLYEFGMFVKRKDKSEISELLNTYIKEKINII